MRLRRPSTDLTCRRAVELITDYLENALPAAQRIDLERHLDQCPHCAEYLAQLRAIILAAGHIDTEDLAPEVRQTLLELYRKTRE